MKIKVFALAILCGVISSSLGYSAVTNWTGNSTIDTTDWNDVTNWSGGVPSVTTVANLVYPAGDTEDIIIGVDSAALGLIYGPDLTFNKFLGTAVGATLTIGSSGITNSSTLAIDHAAVTALGASCTFDAGSLGLTMSSALDVKSNSLTVAASTGTLILSGGTSFSVSSLSTFGNIAGTGAVQLSGALTFDFTSAVGVGTWDFINQTPTGTLTSVQLFDSYAGALVESTPGNWTGNIGGLDWTYLSSTGVLTSVPEPTTWALLAAGLTTVSIFRRRRRN